MWLYVVDVRGLIKEQSTNWAILTSWGFCFRRTTVPTYDQLKIAVLSIFYITSQPLLQADLVSLREVLLCPQETYGRNGTS